MNNNKNNKGDSTIKTEDYLDELKQYVEEHQIIKILEMETKQIMMESELRFHSNIDTITDEQMKKLIDDEINAVEKICWNKVSWKTGMCMLDDKEYFI